MMKISAEILSQAILLQKCGIQVKVALPRAATGADDKIHAVAEYGGRDYTEGYRVIAHRDLEPRHLYRPATMDVRGIDVKVAPNLSVGYVMGVGDDVPQALEQIGVKVTMLGANDLANGHLDQFDSIIIGIRASATHCGNHEQYPESLSRNKVVEIEMFSWSGGSQIAIFHLKFIGSCSWSGWWGIPRFSCRWSRSSCLASSPPCYNQQCITCGGLRIGV